jgi:type VI secretion system protein VasJ
MRLSALGELICAQALELRRTEPQSATALRLVRTGLWLHIDKAPPHVSGVTRIAPLPSGVRATLCGHKAQKRWQILLDEVEKHILKHRMHLDLQRDAALALRNLGAAYAESLAAVEDEVRSFINRVSELPNLQAADKSPLADDATKAWLQKLTQVASASAPAAAPQPITDHLSPTQANKMIPSDALSHFLQRLQHAEAAAEQGHKPVALALFRGLHRQLIKKRLLEWDNALSTRALVGLWRCLQFMPKESQLAEGVFEQIARINPKLAAEIS